MIRRNAPDAPISVDLTDQRFQKVQEFVIRLHRETPNTVWFQSTLICLLSALLREYHNLKVGLKKSTPFLAWACRNMLELDILTKFVLLNGSFAKDFNDDMWIDGIEIFSAARAFIKVHEPNSPTLELNQTIRNFELEKEKQGATRKGHLEMSKMAKDVGFAEYPYMNRLTSKLVHPTAFSVLTPPDEGELGKLKPVFFNSGVRYGLEAFNEIQEYVTNNGVEPLNP